MTTPFMNRFFKRAAFIVIALLGFTQMVHAQPIVGTKTMCVMDSATGTCGTGTLQTSVGTHVAYQFVINNTQGNTPIQNFQVTEDHSPDFVPLGVQPVTCVDQNGNAVNPTFTAGPPAILEFPTLPALALLTCSFEGSFDQPSQSMPNLVHGPGGTHQDGDLNVVVTNAVQINGDLELKKEFVNYADLDLTTGQTTPQIARYRITLSATQTTLISEHFRIFDEMGLGLGSIPLVATLDPNSITCHLNAVPNNICALDANLGNPLSNFNDYNDFISFWFPNQNFLLQSGDTVVLEFDVAYTLPDDAICQRQDIQLAKNAAFLTFANGTTALNDFNNANNSSGYGSSDAVVQQILTDLPSTADCPVQSGGGGTNPPPSPLVVTKKAVDGPGIYQWGDDIAYEIEITNTGAHNITNLNLFDYVQNLAFTPNHDVQLISASLICAPSSICSPLNPSTYPGPLGQIQGYTDTEGMVNGSIDKLVPGETIQLKVVLNFSNPHCDTAPLFEDKFIRNVAAVNHFYTNPDDVTQTLFGTSAGRVDVQMEYVEKCDIGVKKVQLTPGPIIFGQTMEYELLFYNNEADETYGTIIDALRIVDNNYALGMSVDHEFFCADNGGVTGYLNDSNGTQTGTVIHVGQQNQGLRLMDHPGFVTFQQGGELKCNVKITVNQPSDSDPYCFSNINEVPHLENTAFFDQGLFYNSNLAFPTGPQGYNWDAVQTELPRCINATLDKKVSPLAVGPQGPGPLYTIKLQNHSGSGSDGDIAFASGSDNGIHLLDAFDTTNNPILPTLSLTSDPCAGAGAPCWWNSQPQDLFVNQIPAGQSLDFSYTATPNPEFTPHELCNEVNGAFLMGGTAYDPQRWYVRGTMQDRVCVQIRNTINITKVFDIPTDEALLNDQGNIIVDIACTHPDPAITPAPLSTTLNAATGWEANVFVYVGSTCTVTEQAPPTSMLFPHCTWSAPSYAPAQSVITNASQNVWPVELTNSFSCEYADLDVQKLVNPPINTNLVPTTPPAGTSYEIEVLCTDGVNPDITTTLTFGATGGTETLTQIPVGMTCTVSEPTLPNADAGCSWQTVYAPSPDVTIASGLAKSLITSPNQVTVENHYLCEGIIDPVLYDLTVEKIVNAGPADAGYVLSPVPANANFAITPDCGNGALSTLNFTGAGTQIITDQPLGALCTATESISSSNPNDTCRWRSDITGTTIAATGVNTVIVENNFECPEPLKVTKSCDPIPLGASEPYTLNCEIEITGGANLPLPSWVPFADFFRGPLLGGTLAPAPGTMVFSSTDVTLHGPPLCQYTSTPSAQGICLIDSAEIVANGGSATIDAQVTFSNPDGWDVVSNCAYIGEPVEGTLPGVGEPSSGAKMSKSLTLTDSVYNTDDPEWHCVDIPLPPKEITPPEGDLSITKTLIKEDGPNKTYELEPALTGDPITAPDLYVLDHVPAGMSVLNAGGNGWQCAPLPLTGPDTLECRYTGTYPITAGPMSSIYVEVIDKGAKELNCAEITTDKLQNGYLDTDLSNNRDCEKETGKSDVSIEKTLEQVEPGYGIFTLQVGLTGGPITSAMLLVSDDVPSGMTLDFMGNAPWVCQPANVSGPATVTCEYQGTYPILPNTPIPPIRFKAEYKEGVENCAEVITEAIDDGFDDSNPDNNSDCVTTTGKPDISIEKTLEELEPGVGIFTLQVGLTGGPLTSPMLRVHDFVPNGMYMEFIGNSPWDCQPAQVTGPQTVTCEYQGNYPIQPNTTIPPIRFKAEYKEGMKNCAEIDLEKVEDGFDDSNPDNNSDCLTTTGTPVIYKDASFEIAKGIDPNGAPAPAGSTFHFTITNCTDGGTPDISSFTFTAPNDFGSPLGARQRVHISGATSPTPSCLVTELTPSGPLPAGCAWLPPRLSIDNGANWSIGSISVPAAAAGNGPTIVPVSNRLECKKPKERLLTLIKTVTDTSPVGGPLGTANVSPPPASVTYPILITCRDSAGAVVGTQTHTFPSTGGSISFPNAPVGVICTATEGVLPVEKGCKWSTVITPAGGVTIPATGNTQIEVVITYLCEPIQIELPRRFDVIKEIHPDSAPIPLGTDFPFTATGCNTQMDNFTFEYSSGFNGATATQTIAHTGGACTVTEQTPVSTLDDGCSWAAPEYSTDNRATWSTNPASFSGTQLQIVGAALPAVHVRNRLVCTPPPPFLEISKTCVPNPLILTAPGPQQVTCTLTLTGGNMIPGQLIQVSDIITGASGAMPIINTVPLSNTGMQFLGCQSYNAPNEVLCLINSADLVAQGSLSTDLTFTVDNAWETGDLQNCVRGFHQALGNGSYGSATVCEDITVVKQTDPKPTGGVASLAINKASLGDCSVNRAAQTYTCGFGFEITNEGDGAYQGPLVVTDEFLNGPKAQSVMQTGGDGWSCPGNNADGASCLKGVSSIAAGASDGFQMELTLSGLRKGGQFCNAATLGLGESDFMRTIVVQEAMRLLGIDGGPADGRSGDQTKRGVRALQSNLGLEQTGEIDATLLTALGVPMDVDARSDEVCVDLPPMPLPPLQCDKRTARNISDTACACRYEGMFKSSKTSCSCEKGLNFVAGKGCVKPDRPKSCPDGQTRINGECAIVEEGPLQCDPRSTVARGDTCACKFQGMKRLNARQCI